MAKKSGFVGTAVIRDPLKTSVTGKSSFKGARTAVAGHSIYGKGKTLKKADRIGKK